jgi:hypothetical protein
MGFACKEKSPLAIAVGYFFLTKRTSSRYGVDVRFDVVCAERFCGTQFFQYNDSINE